MYIERVTIKPKPPSLLSLEQAKAKIPTEYHDYVKIFSKEHSQRLPKHTIQDHTIELLPGAPTTLLGRLLPLT